MVRIQKIVLGVIAALFVPWASTFSFARVDVSDGFGMPRGMMNWSINSFWSYQPFEKWPVRPKILINESIGWNGLRNVDGAVTMLGVSGYLLGHYELPFGRSGISAFLSAGPGIHVLSSLASGNSPAISTSNTEVAFKGHVIGGLKYGFTRGQFVSLSVRSTFPTDSPIDCGYISYGRSLGNNSDEPSRADGWTAISRFGITSRKDDYAVFSANGIVAKRLGDRITLGLGAGWDCTKYVLVTPLFLDFRAYVKESGSSFYFAVDGGYAGGWVQRSKAFERNGAFGYVGAGLALPYIGANAINFELGAKMEQTVSSYYEGHGGGGNGGPLPNSSGPSYYYDKEYHISGVAQIGFQFGL